MSKSRTEVLEESRRKGLKAGAGAAVTVVLGVAIGPVTAAVAAGHHRAWAGAGGRTAPKTASNSQEPTIFADTFTLPAPGVVAVLEYGSSPRHRHRFGLGEDQQPPS